MQSDPDFRDDVKDALLAVVPFELPAKAVDG